MSTIRSFHFLYTLIISFGLFSISSEAHATVRLEWLKPETNVDGSEFNDFSHYEIKLESGQGRNFSSTIVANTNFHYFDNLSSGVYRAVVIAVDTSGNKSSESSPIHFHVVDGWLDSDGDGVSDRQELIDGTNPNDRGSHLPVHEKEVCAPSNNNLGMLNVFEISNASTRDLEVLTESRNSSGIVEETYNFPLGKGLQRDLLVHDFKSRKPNTYGTICSTSNGSPGDIRGKMAFYKPSSDSDGFDFALLVPATSPRTGIQVSSMNTYQPSLALQDQDNALMSWMQLTNNNDSGQSGTLKFWLSNGSLFAEVPVSLPAGSRVDLPMHEIGRNQVGFVEWIPANRGARFTLNSIRYFYDNPWFTNSFNSAVFLPGGVGTGELIGAQYDTRGSSSILEISNILNSTESALVRVYAEDGNKLHERSIDIGAKSTFHLVLDGLAPEQRGLVTVQPTSMNAVFATVMEYKRRADGGIYYLSAMPVVPPLGNVLTDTYNTYLGQDMELIVANFSSENVKAFVTMTRSSGEKIIKGEPLELSANSIKVINLNERERADEYGIIRIEAPLGSSVSAWASRIKQKQYKLTTQAQQ